MSDENSTDTAKTASPIAWPELPEPVKIQLQALLHEQAQYLQETQKVLASWTKRRQEAMAAQFRSLQAMGSSKDLATLGSAYTDWLTDNMNRIFDDMNEVSREALRMAEAGRKSLTVMLESAAAGVQEAASQASQVGKEQAAPKRKAAE